LRAYGGGIGTGSRGEYLLGNVAKIEGTEIVAAVWAGVGVAGPLRKEDQTTEE